MEELDLYKFIEEERFEYHWIEKIDDERDVIMFVEDYKIEEWNKMLKSSIYDEEGIECIMKDGYFCFYMKDICEYFGIEIERIFRKEE